MAIEAFLSVGSRRSYTTAHHHLNLWKTLLPASRQTALKVDSQKTEFRHYRHSSNFSRWPFSAFKRYYSSFTDNDRTPCLNIDQPRANKVSSISDNTTKLVSAVTWCPVEDRHGLSYVHCPLCDYQMIYPRDKERNPAIIFLDIDGVLIELVRPTEVVEKIEATKKELFPHQKGHYSGYQQNIATARHFNRDAIAGLDKIIEKIENSGQRPLVVLSSSWRHASWLNELRSDAYSQYKFSHYLCGKTSLDCQVEKHLSVESKCGFEFYKTAQEVYGIQLENRANAIEFWLKDHGFDSEGTNFIVLDDEHEESLSKFGQRFIKTKWLLKETNVQAAIDILCS